MSLKLPPQVRITAKVAYEILYDNTMDHYGECRYDTKQIILNPNKSNTDIKKTLLHEVIHAMDLEMHRGYRKVDENTVLILEKGLYRMNRLNKWIRV